jgi:hypothetical protein
LWLNLSLSYHRSPWMLRIVLDRKKKEDKNLTNNEIAERINQVRL